MKLIIPQWSAPKNIKAFSSTRFDGVSNGVYKGLNLGTHVGDDESIVIQNRNRLVKHSNMPSNPIWLNQTHSTTVLNIGSPTESILDADGLFTQQPNVVCSAMTADCLPVLLTNTQGSQVAAVHAGWRGLANGILENAVEKFDGEVIAWLGPAIGKNAFEVGDDVVNAFVEFDEHAIEAFQPQSQPQANKYLADIGLLATQRLNRAGVQSVFNSNLCTYRDADSFYSYRRDGITGRQAAFIWIE
ncbi:peptidoglycan editing factor PgeF [Vibrio genomosp. F6]|uniref:peptidoglycan editing factor PgeF n=1 Tax=Vibrio genomosp. F6 TaxID=723172 RepID=UPI0010BDA0AA|nr:peptidoglycan editing factor PgeF [Vibrio genomosp. F6]TKF23276.1 peptidoglycan editing factor PgeF [Vibrio genomosp. F6]